MTVEELIEKLSNLDKNRLVKVRTNNRYRDIDSGFDDGYVYDAGKDIEFYEM